MLKNKQFYFVFLLLCFFTSLNAQINSPYSRYGYGVLRDQAVGPSKAMGGVGYGLRNNQSANPMNPASYSKVDSLTFLFDIGASFQMGKLSDSYGSKRDYNGGLDYLTILVPLHRGLGLSFGLLPYSSVGYSFGKTQTLENVTYEKSFSGEGGISQVYAGLGYLTPLKGFSVGANASFLFGTLSHTRSLPIVGSSANITSLEFVDFTLKAFKFDLGVQYQYPISEKRILTIGAVYSPQIDFKGDYNKRYYEIESTGTKGDTINLPKLKSSLPATYGLGATMLQYEKLTVGLDFTYQTWKNINYPSVLGDGLDANKRFNNRWKVALGGEYMIDPYDRSFIKKMKFRGGINLGNSYINTANSTNEINGYNEYGGSLGIGIPVRDNIGGRISYVNVSFDYKKIAPKAKNMLSEDYIGVSVSLNLNEFWFFKNKIR